MTYQTVELPWCRAWSLVAHRDCFQTDQSLVKSRHWLSAATASAFYNQHMLCQGYRRHTVRTRIHTLAHQNDSGTAPLKGCRKPDHRKYAGDLESAGARTVNADVVPDGRRQRQVATAFARNAIHLEIFHCGPRRLADGFATTNLREGQVLQMTRILISRLLFEIIQMFSAFSLVTLHPQR